MAQEAEQYDRGTNIFEDAMQSFATGVSPEVLDQFQNVISLNDLKIAISDIEREQAARRSFRNLKKINPFLDGLRDYAAVIEVFVNAKPEIMAFIWGPIKFCLQVASKYSHAFDSLLEAYGRIREALPNFVLIEQLYASQHEAVRLLLLHVYTDILNFHKRAVRFFSKPGWKIAIKMTCRALNDCFGDVLQNLQYTQQLLYTRTDLTHYHESHQARLRTEQAFREQQEREKQSRRLKVHAWLDAFSHKNQQHELQAIRADYPGTCTWLFEDRCWMDWITSTSNNRKGFWMSGIPGAGKTVLFSAMVSELQNSISRSHAAGTVIYIYCKYRDSLRDNFIALARSLINMLLEQNDTAYDYMYDVAVNSIEQVPTTRENLLACFLDLLQFHERVYLGIDGLDEIEPQERASMIQLIQRLLALPEDNNCARVFLTSRAEHDLEKAFCSLSRIALDSTYVTPDIQTYAQIRVKELEFLQVEKSVLKQLVPTVVSRSDGMFLLARLTFDMLCLCVTKEDFRYELENRDLPQGIEEAYNRILERISAREKMTRRPKAARLLELLTFACRTLYLHEVQTALSINVKQRDIDFENRRYTQPFKQICGTLIEVNSDDSVTFLAEKRHDMFEVTGANLRIARLSMVYLSLEIFRHENTDDAINSAVLRGCFGFYRYAFCNWILHAIPVINSPKYSREEVRDFIIEIDNVIRKQSLITSETTIAQVLSTDMLKTQQQVAEVLKLLMQGLEAAKNKSSEHSGTVAFEKATHHERRIQGAIEHAVVSASSTQAKDFLTLAYGNVPFLCQNLGCSRSQKGFKSEEERNSHSKTHERPYKCDFRDCIFSATGFPSKTALQKHAGAFHLEDLSLKFSQLQARAPEERLAEAIDMDDVETVQAICSQQASKGYYPRKPWLLAVRALQIFGSNNLYAVNSVLAAASGTSDAEAIHLALETLNRQFWVLERSRVIRHVVRNGQPSVLRLLIQYLRSKRIALQYKFNVSLVLHNQHPVEMCKAILKFPKDCMLDKKKLYNDCKRFAEEPNQDLLKLLLPVAISKNVFSGSAKQLLHSASTVEEQVEFFQQPDFWQAVLSGDPGGIRTALEMGIHRNLTGELPRTALAIAARKGELSTVQYLVERTDLVTSSDTYSTALHQAILNDDISIVEYLVERGADLRVELETNGAALHQIASKGHLSIVRHLIEIGADVNASSEDHGTALHQAASNGHLLVVEYLVEMGADIEARSESHGTALHLAASNDRLPVVQYLLKMGADYNACSYTWKYGTPLYEAASKGYLSIVKCLVNYGAEFRAKSGVYGTPCFVAAHKGYFRVVGYLKEKGATH